MGICKPEALSSRDQATETFAVLLAKGQRHHRSGRTGPAEAAYRQILRSDPNQPETLNYLGVLLHQTGRSQGGLDLLRRSVELAPKSADFHDNFARALQESGVPAEAARHYRDALALAPVTAERFYNLGNALSVGGAPADAATAYRQAIDLKPSFSEAYNHLGTALQALGNERQDIGKLEEAVAAYRSAIGINGKYVDAYNNLGNAFMALQRHGGNASGGRKRAMNERGSSWLADAEAAYRRAIELEPERAGTYSNLGNALLEQNRLSDAAAAYDTAIAILPDDAGAHWNRSQALLMLGRFAEGWEEYEWRWRLAHYHGQARHENLPAWDGTSLDGRAILVWPEQGVGDEVMFASLMPDISAAGRCILECDPRLVPLFARSFPNIEVVPKRQPPEVFEERQGVEFQSPIGSLPRWIRPDRDRFPSHNGYLRADPERTEICRARYAGLGDGPKIGISWRSGNPQIGRQRSALLEHWRPVFEQSGAHFVNVQYGDCAVDLKDVRQRFGVDVHHDESIDPLASLDDFAAQISALDLIISIDNSTVHVAGALGRPVWTLLPAAPNWRWLSDQDSSPWYPSMKLFRQTRADDWSDVFERVAQALAEIY